VARNLTFSGLLRFRPTWTEPLDLVDVVDSSDLAYTQALANGTGTGQANAYYRDVITVAASSTETLDLADLALQFYGGNGSLSLASVKALLARVTSASGSIDLALGTSVTATILAGNVLYATALTSGWADASLTLDNTGGTAVDIEIHLIGVAT
jgi:hypothetical protein